MTELRLYDKDGLFHNIVRKSAVMAGRYHVLPNGTNDLNSSNITGIELPKEKYPLVACLAPASYVNPSAASGQWEHFSFRVLFLTNAEKTGDNQFKGRDHLTNTSQARTPADWHQMKMVALAFMNALEQLQPQAKAWFQLDQRSPWQVRRITRTDNDQLNGVMLSFGAMVATVCIYPDISEAAIKTIVIPTA